MDTYNIALILSSVFEYTQDQSSIECYESNYLASAVLLKTLEKHIKKLDAEKYRSIIEKYSSFANFLMDKKTQDISKRWCLEITTIQKYKENSLLSKFHFTSFKFNIPSDEEPLFIIYRFEKRSINRQKTSLEDLCQEIFDCSKHFFLSRHDFNDRENIKAMLNYAVQFNFPEIGATVELIGGSKYRLDFTDSNLKLAIRTSNVESFYGFYDTQFLSDYLEDIGIQNINFMQFNQSCSFVSPSGISCQIGIISDSFTFELDQLIFEYLKLDKRVKPLVCAVLYFLKCKNENELRYSKILDVHTSIIMVLEFLVKGVKRPLIPNLRGPIPDCKSSNCLYNSYLTKAYNLHVRYHNCVRIENNAVGNKYSNIKYNLIKPTLWSSNNGDNLADLLKTFFEYYSQKDNLLRYILADKSYGNGTVPRQREYIQYENFDFNDRLIGEEICKVFSNAFELLKGGGREALIISVPNT